MYQYRVHVLSSPIPKAMREKKKRPSVSGAFQTVPSTVNFILGISRADLWIQVTVRYSRGNELLRRSLCFRIFEQKFYDRECEVSNPCLVPSQVVGGV